MKKIAVASLAVLAMGQTHAQTLEERIEALEYQSYENFFKMSGQMEMRYDYVNRDNKQDYTIIDTAKGSAKTIEEGTDSSKFARMYLNLDMESRPSDRLTFYGRLSMAKYLGEISSQGSDPNSGVFTDLSAGANASDSSVWVERAFANYAISDSLTFTFGRLPTIDGAPMHHHRNQPMAGSYPILAFSAIFDGMALTKTHGNHTFRAIYTPFSTPNYGDSISRNNNSSGDKLERTTDNYALMYEYQKDVSWARNVHVIAMHNMVNKMPLYLDLNADGNTNSDLELTLNRTSLYAEALDVAGSGFDVAVHGMVSSTKSEGGAGTLGGWLTADDSDTNTGSAYGALVKYNFKNGFMKNSALGVEHFVGNRGAFLYDSANVDPVSMYTTYGNATRVFYAKDFEGGLKWTAQYMRQQQDYTYQAYGIIGEEVETDRQIDFVSTSFIVNF